MGIVPAVLCLTCCPRCPKKIGALLHFFRFTFKGAMPSYTVVMNQKTTQWPAPRSSGGSLRRCLSCGTTRNMTRRKYCSVTCRQELRDKLNRRTGLLCALGARFATFSFTDYMVILDVLAYDCGDIASFVYPRLPKSRPALDFVRLANHMSNLWWREKERTHKRYLASQQVYEKAVHRATGSWHLRPVTESSPAVRKDSLVRLRLTPDMLVNGDIEAIVKQAFRQQAKVAHPDLGGNSANFRNLLQAYEELLHWAANPTFIRRRGFVDRWFYEGETNRWQQPAALKANGS